MIETGEHSDRHEYPAERWRVGKGRPYAHAAARCYNCHGPHFTHANACPRTREARLATEGCRPPLPPRRQRKDTSGDTPSTSPPPEDGALYEIDRIEVEERASAPEDAMAK